jgi:cell shape-determining protein MreC
VISGSGATDDLSFRAGLIDLDYIPNTADVKVGDRVITSGVDGIYPKGFVVGEIQSVEREAGEFRIRVRPAVDFSSLETVLVVRKAPSITVDADEGR